MEWLGGYWGLWSLGCLKNLIMCNRAEWWCNVTIVVEGYNVGVVEGCNVGVM